MTTTALAKPAGLAPGLRILFLGFLFLLLVCVPAQGGHSPWPPEGLDKTPEHLRTADPQASRCPLPPTSAFSRQTQLLRYLHSWPAPGATATEDWPEYVPEEGEEGN